MLDNKVIVLASSNQGKAREFGQLLAPLGFTIKLQKEFGVADAEENGLSFLENALIKARHASIQTGLPALADDSGICVDLLKGAPGIHSARFAEHGNDEANNAKLLESLKAWERIEERTARYVCALALVRHPDDPLPLTALATWDGFIGLKPAGSRGFGYDPLFVLQGRGLTAAQLPEQTKNLISHRGRAMKKLCVLLQKYPLD
ncbi:MAG: RdgB/HAM1 family non-canonical purine NTP pyrophosphatase [Proteobacteria bacterium]|uniref:dITP/XTP pyrophosphatase n=1 Tax=Candidatus Avisuccinivibrio stercorigallinarum TaxID=2840704 RepID=A0A9D9DDV4_9GAMM|nr:RdgB/HAM1 family non-canonical purine NTP pyrophosphatase [Candidatus Avisuccinivibrio stercorigallinarum]